MTSRSNWEDKTSSKSMFGRLGSKVADAALRATGKPTNAFEAEMDIESKRTVTTKPKQKTDSTPKPTTTAPSNPIGDYGTGITGKLKDEIEKQTK